MTVVGEKMKKNKQFLWLAICIVIYLAVFILTKTLGKISDTSFYIGTIIMPVSSFLGVLQSLQFMLCISMVCADHKRGPVLAYILTAGSILSTSLAMIIMKVYSALPGVTNMMITIIAVFLLSRQFAISEKEKVTDYLTGLSNRRGLAEILKAKTSKKKEFYVLYIDLKNFKLINDNLGHRCGDTALKIISERMSAIIGRKDTLCRIGGDEFVLVLSSESDPKKISELIVDSISRKISLSTGETIVDSYVSAYVGISKFPDDTDNADKLIKFADIAMYQAMKSSVDKICFFDEKMESELFRQMELERIIKESLDNDNFYMVYQPQYEINQKKLRGFESLIRLKTQTGEVISPAEFIPVAEKTDLILRIDHYVIRRVLREFKEPLEKAGNSFVVSVNVSAKNIASFDFADKVKEMIEEVGFPPQCLEIEITEYCLVQSLELTIMNISKLREIGVQIALDDFGTGYTSLSYLAKLPINLLKIDKSLIDDIELNSKSRDFANAVISMGHMMGCEVISEGVENDKQLELLADHKCDFVQGYVWGKPMDYEKAVEFATQ